MLMLTVCFEDPFWVGIVERVDGTTLQVARVVFGAEPTGAEVLDWINQHFYWLSFGAVHQSHAETLPRNPKRLKREAQASRQQRSRYTHEALQKDLETRAKERQASAREKRALLKEERWEHRKARKLEKRKGH